MRKEPNRLPRLARGVIDRLPDDGEALRWARGGWSRFRRSKAPQRVLAPLVVNIAVHGALLTALAVLWAGVRPREAPAPDFALVASEGGVEVSMAAPAAPAADEAGERARGTLAAAGEALSQGPGSLPTLTGVSGSGGELPALRSLSQGGDPSSMLRRRSDRIVGSASFAGVGADEAASVVYVVDASGAMVTSLPLVVAELKRSISALKPTQQFQIVMFRNRREGPALEVFQPAGGAQATALVRATRRNREAAFAWLGQVRPEGASSPIEGLRLGLALKPDVVFLLARSIVRSGEGAAWGGGRAATLAELDRLNPAADRRSGRRLVQIKTIQFIDEDPTGVMRAIGDIHGGGAAGHTLLTLEELRGR